MGAVTVDMKRGVCQIGTEHFPMVGLGTYRLLGDVCARVIQEAVQVGYRIIDTATFYHNFDGFAAALKKLDRSQLYIASKVWHDKQSPEDLGKDLEATLKQMNTELLDAYFLHWPNSKIPIENTLAAMQKWQKAGKIRHIGLCNVSVNHLKRALEVGIPIDWVQIEMHPFFCDGPLLAFCKQHQIAIQAWRPLDVGRVSEDGLLC
jgi:2,5-diketo-D-gluconate reductase B